MSAPVSARPDLLPDPTWERVGGLLTSDARQALVGLADALFPSEPADPGALSSGALDYIAALVDGDDRLRELYETELTSARGRVSVADGEPDWDALVRTLMTEAADEDLPLQLSGAPSPDAILARSGQGTSSFVLLLWQHVREGLFCDPRHGGNTDAVMWRWLGYPGVQLHGYSESELAENALPTRPMRTAVDWLDFRE